MDKTLQNSGNSPRVIKKAQRFPLVWTTFLGIALIERVVITDPKESSIGSRTNFP